MDEAKVDVGRMKQNLAIKNQELAKASKEAEALLKSISESTAIAEKEKNKVAVIVESVSSKAAEIAAVKAGCEKDLAAAQPALDAVRMLSTVCFSMEWTDVVTLRLNSCCLSYAYVCQHC